MNVREREVDNGGTREFSQRGNDQKRLEKIRKSFWRKNKEVIEKKGLDERRKTIYREHHRKSRASSRP